MANEKWKQQVHKDCGGSIVVIARMKDAALCCDKCSTVWELPLPFPLGSAEEWQDPQGFEIVF